MVLLIIIPTKWLFHWGYTPFQSFPIWQTGDSSAVTKAMALKVIDLLLHFGLSDLPGFLLEEAVQARGGGLLVAHFFSEMTPKDET